MDIYSRDCITHGEDAAEITSSLKAIGAAILVCVLAGAALLVTRRDEKPVPTTTAASDTGTYGSFAELIPKSPAALLESKVKRGMSPDSARPFVTRSYGPRERSGATPSTRDDADYRALLATRDARETVTTAETSPVRRESILGLIKPSDRAAIEAACRITGEVQGPGPYNRCLTHGIGELRDNPPPAFVGIAPVDRAAIEAACRITGEVQGPGPYNRCLAQGIADLRDNPSPTFAGISTVDRHAIEAACRITGEVQGPGPYNKCLLQGVRDLRANPKP